MQLSIVIPLLNEEKSLPELYNWIIEVMQANNYSYEIIFIDDGSTDQSSNKIKDIVSNDNQVTLISLKKNYGKSNALNIGFDMSRGDIVVTMDADLQDDPYEIKNLLAKIEEGWDVVSGWKEDRKDPYSKRIPSKIFNFIVRKN